MASGGHEAVKAISPALPLPNRMSMRASTSATRPIDATRKQSAGSGDHQSSRKPATPPPKAWQGANPITTRANNTPATPNGIDRPSPKATPISSATGMGSQGDKQAHERLVFLLASMTGLDATVSLKNGEQYAGILGGYSFDGPNKASYVLKMVTRTRLPTNRQGNGVEELCDEYIGHGDDHSRTFDVADTSELSVNNVQLGSQLTNGNTGTSFRTDTEISRTTDLPRERTLQRWAPEATDMSLDDLALEESGTGSWDQFKANEQMYGVTSSFDMDMYTTAINKSHPLHTQREMEAKRLAKEIEGSAAANSHVAEERQQNISSAEAGDEEEKYSGVRRDYSLAKSGSGSYVPPSRRPLTNAPTVPGAPYDPAIISSQLAKPQPAHPAPDESTKSEDKPAGTDASVESVVTSAPASALKASPNTTEGHVRDTADAFKQFANTEKLRIRQAQEQKRTNARNEKNVRINDLKKFAENFKLKSRVPDDLVPILAKDHEKQQEIRRKAEEAAQVEEQRAKDTPPSASPSSASRPSSKEQAAIPQQPSRQKPLPNRSQFVPQLLPNMTPRQLQVFKSNAGRGIVPAQQLPQMHVPSGPAQVQEQQVPSTNTNGPNAGSRLSIMSAKAFEFRPAASTFMPSGASPSPQRSTTESVAPPTPATFFDDKEKSNLGKSTDEDLDQDCNVIVYLQTAGVAGLTDDQKKSLASVGGVPQPYRTPPTWNVPQDRINTLYEDAFGKIMVPEVTMMQHMAGQIPHAHQLPQHMQGHMSAQQARYFQQTGMPHAHAQGFDPRMQYSGAPGSLQSSPRFPNAQVTMGQMPQFMGMPQFAGQSMPYAGMSPNLAFRQPHVPGNANQMMMLPGQQHGSMATMRGYQQQGQHFAPNMPQMMVQPGQPFANGQIPQQPYSPLPHNAQPHVQHMGQHPGQAGFPASPRPGPHVMHHTNSHQGFAPHQMGMYTALPGQGSPYAMNQRQMSAGHFPQMTPRQQQAVPTNQAQPSPSPATTGQNTGKNDEGK